MGPPPMPQPKQCHKFLAGVTTRLAVASSWNGHRPSQSLPDFFSSMPEASTRRSTDTLLFSRSIPGSGMRGVGEGSWVGLLCPSAAQGFCIDQASKNFSRRHFTTQGSIVNYVSKKEP